MSNRKIEAITVGVSFLVIGIVLLKDDIRIFTSRKHHHAVPPAVRKWRALVKHLMFGI